MFVSNFKDLDRLLESFTKTGPAGCGCALAKNGKTIYENYFGYSDLETKTLMTEENIYRLWSMTKVIVCTAALILFERGKYLLDDPLYEFFPEYKDIYKVRINAHGVTDILPVQSPMLVKHAFSMAVGLPYPGGPSYSAGAMKKIKDALNARPEKYTLREEIREMSKVPIAFEPVTHFMYGYGHELVAGLIEAVSGMTMGEFLQKEIFDPLGMESTGYRYKGDLKSKMASFYLRGADGSLTKAKGLFDDDHEPDAIYEAGGAGLFSSVRDYLKFTQMLAGGGELDGVKIIGRKTIDLMRRNQLDAEQLIDFNSTTPYVAGYGYGLGVRTLMDPAQGNNNAPVGEFGWTGFMGTYTSIDPGEGFSLVYMHQMSPNMERQIHHRVRAAAYGCL
jgi:CubicO group peptidase (beta-lactamase class C family)